MNRVKSNPDSFADPDFTSNVWGERISNQRWRGAHACARFRRKSPSRRRRRGRRQRQEKVHQTAQGHRVHAAAAHPVRWFTLQNRARCTASSGARGHGRCSSVVCTASGRRGTHGRGHYSDVTRNATFPDKTSVATNEAHSPSAVCICHTLSESVASSASAFCREVQPRAINLRARVRRISPCTRCMTRSMTSGSCRKTKTGTEPSRPSKMHTFTRVSGNGSLRSFFFAGRAARATAGFKSRSHWSAMESSVVLQAAWRHIASLKCISCPTSFLAMGGDVRNRVLILGPQIGPVPFPRPQTLFRIYTPSGKYYSVASTSVEGSGLSSAGNRGVRSWRRTFGKVPFS